MLICWAALDPSFAADSPTADGPIEIRRLTGEVSVDGDLLDAGWRDAAQVTTWFETRPGDNLPADPGNVAWLGYDDEFLYAAFRFTDPDPARIRAPFADRDRVPGYTDYGGLIIDANNDGKTAQMFLANARGIQYDAISSDASGEDSAPDFFWDSAARIGPEGWTLEMRIPFSSLRYGGSRKGSKRTSEAVAGVGDPSAPHPEEWGIMLYRNYPRDHRYQHFSSRLSRDSNCFICNVRPLLGLEDLPSGGHWVIAPFATGSQLFQPRDGLGSGLDAGDAEGDAGIDLKWLPNPSTVVDATVNPDFSQVESDAAQISTNERFALFFPERRPFFLEGIDLFSTPLRAVYTRSFTQPRWGLRATGELGGHTYTMLVGQDEGGGSVIIPGTNSSSLAEQDFESLVAIGRWRRDLGSSFVSVLYSGREIDGGAYNRVIGPDFRWQPNDSNTVTGQILFSQSETPDRIDLADEWNGRTLSGHAAELWWHRNTSTWDSFLLYNDIDDEFRADNGFLPEVGVRSVHYDFGRTFYPEDRPVTRIRLFTFGSYAEDREGNLLRRGVIPGFGLDGILSSFVRLELALEDVLGVTRVHRRHQVRPTIVLRPGRRLSQIEMTARVGEEVDFANDRLGDGVNVDLGVDLQPTDHLQIGVSAARRWLDVDAENGRSGRLFTADVARLRAVYTFNAKSWLRLIGQWVETERDPTLYLEEVDDKSGAFSGSAVFAYKLNWQSVLFVGGSQGQVLDDRDDLQTSDRQLFLKVSYAFQG